MIGLLSRIKHSKYTVNQERHQQERSLRVPAVRSMKKGKNNGIKRKLTVSLVLTFLLPSSHTIQALAEPSISVPDIESESAIVIDGDNGSVLYEKNADESLYPASLTKIVTAIYAIETGNLEEMTTVSENARNVDGTKVYLEEGEQVTLKKLVQGLLINSGNDAGVAIAEQLSGSVEQYARDINDYLKNVIGVEHTTFQNPHGLFDENHVTTAEDLAIITKYAMNNGTFKEIFGTKELKWDGETWDTTLYSHHKMLLGYEGITGGKTGYVDESGVTLATTAERDGRRLIIITLKSESQAVAYQDTTALLDYGFGPFETSLVSEGTSFEYNESVYKAPAEFTYTHSPADHITKRVAADGILEIVNQHGQVINSFQLDLIPKISTAAAESNPEISRADHAGPIWKSTAAKLLFIAVIILVCGAGVFKRRNVHQERYKKAK